MVGPEEVLIRSVELETQLSKGEKGCWGWMMGAGVREM